MGSTTNLNWLVGLVSESINSVVSFISHSIRGIFVYLHGWLIYCTVKFVGKIMASQCSPPRNMAFLIQGLLTSGFPSIKAENETLISGRGTLGTG